MHKLPNLVTLRPALAIPYSLRLTIPFICGFLEPFLVDCPARSYFLKIFALPAIALNI